MRTPHHLDLVFVFCELVAFIGIVTPAFTGTGGSG
jgi:hypothetical protein